MKINWHKVAVYMNSDAHKELEIAGQQEDPEAAKEYRIRGFLLKSLADALFEGIENEQ